MATIAQLLKRRQEAIASLESEFGWEQIYEDSFFDDIVAAGFYSTTLREAFVLAQIVENIGPISVRGAFYRAVSMGIFPDTSEEHYAKTGSIILKLRRKGCLSYSKIADGTRTRKKPSSWTGLAEFMDSVRACYRKDLWSRQPECIEIFCEKDAMAGVLQPVTNEYDVALNIIRGDVSETFAWNIAEVWNSISKPICAYYLGDHDPSGLRIEQTLKTKLEGFCEEPFRWQRLAIDERDFCDPDRLGFRIKGDRNKKAWQTRHREYLAEFGDRCVEVDALSPEEIRGRVKEAIESHIDQGEWSRLKANESAERESVKHSVLAQNVA